MVNFLLASTGHAKNRLWHVDSFLQLNLLTVAFIAISAWKYQYVLSQISSCELIHYWIIKWHDEVIKHNANSNDMVSQVEAYKATDRDDEVTAAKKCPHNGSRTSVQWPLWRQYSGHYDVSTAAIMTSSYQQDDVTI